MFDTGGRELSAAGGGTVPVCCMCHEDKPEEAFAFRSLASGKRQAHCRTCHAAYRRAHYQRNRKTYIAREVARIAQRRAENRRLLVEYLATHPCIDCGEVNVVLLEFDHRDPTTKTGSVTVLALTRTWKRVLAEIAKCDVRCVSCHRRRTAMQRGWWKLSLVERAEKAVEALPQYERAAETCDTRTCKTCRQTLPISEFSLRNARTGRRSLTCRSCIAARSREHYRKHVDLYRARNRRRDRSHDLDARRSLVMHYLLSHPCVDCGETEPLLLEFDHRDPAAKTGTVGDRIAHGTREQLLAEIAKCDVRCARCHRLKTARDFGWTRAVLEPATMYTYAGVA